MQSSTPAIRLLTEVKLRLSSHTVRFSRFLLLSPSLKSHKNHKQDSLEWLGALQSFNDFGSLVRLKPLYLLLFLAWAAEKSHIWPRPGEYVWSLGSIINFTKEVNTDVRGRGIDKSRNEGGTCYLDAWVYVLLFSNQLLICSMKDDSVRTVSTRQLKRVDHLMRIVLSVQIFTVASIFKA